MTIAYSPKHLGLTTGLAGVFASPNKWVSGGMVVAGWAWDSFTTFWDRQRKKETKDNHEN